MNSGILHDKLHRLSIFRWYKYVMQLNNLILVILFTVTWANCTTLTPCLTTSSNPKPFMNHIWLDLPLSDSLAEWPVVEVQSALSTLPKRPEEWPESPIDFCPFGCGQPADVLSFLLALDSCGEGNWTNTPAGIYTQPCQVTIEFHMIRNKWSRWYRCTLWDMRHNFARHLVNEAV